MRRKKKRRSALGLAAMVLIVVVLIVSAIRLLGSADNMAESEQTRGLERAIHNAVVSCYAIEGRYPDSLEKIQSEYGVIVDEEKFDVTYEASFAANMMPTVIVELKGEN